MVGAWALHLAGCSACWMYGAEHPSHQAAIRKPANITVGIQPNATTNLTNRQISCLRTGTALVLGQLACRREAASTCDATDTLTDFGAFRSIFLSKNEQ